MTTSTALVWDWQSSDGTYVRSPLGGPDNGPNPTDRAKPGMKDVLLVDGRGVPLAVITVAANVNDHLALPDLLDNPVLVRPQPTTATPQHLCLEAAFATNRPATRSVGKTTWDTSRPKVGVPKVLHHTKAGTRGVG